MKNRKIGYTYGSLSGHFPFRKEKSIAFESPLERDFLTLFEFNDSVCDIIEQPMTIYYTNSDGVKTQYTPDFLVYFNEPEASLLRVQRKPILVEVKPNKKLQKKFHDYKERFKIAVKYAHENDMIFKIYDESRIRNQYLENILFLKRYKRLKYDKSDEDNILAYINSVGETRIENLLEYLFASKEQKTIGLAQVWNLLANKKLLTNFNQPLNKKSIVWMNNTTIFEGEHHE
jgi:hypothetical protein